ncbi:MAG: LTA synthase family protein, partial [Clostridia bacterium]|nr:LTA synthase family protein [Clostridia bacterium]
MKNQNKPVEKTVKKRKEKADGRLTLLLFPLSVVYFECLLRLFDKSCTLFGAALPRVLLFSLGAGLLLSTLLSLIQNDKIRNTVSITLLSILTVYFCIQYCCKNYFKTYFSVGYMTQMAGQAVGDFGGNIPGIIWNALPFILLSFVPLAAFIYLRKKMGAMPFAAFNKLFVMVLIAALCHVGAVMLVNQSATKTVYTYDYSTDAAVPEYGLLTATRLEAQYAIFGRPEPELPVIEIKPDPAPTQSAQVEEEVVEEIVYDFNTMDFDFTAMAAEENNSTYAAIHQYMASLTPSQQNEYTGMFEGKNLILITAEAFSPYVIDEELTPTLYRLATEGVVCTDFYQPNWTQSTTGGEFAVMTGLIPNWIGNDTTFKASIGNNMHTALGWQFRQLGYAVPAWHNNSYTYYNRHLTHPNLGYDYAGEGGGLDLSESWPYSDLEMMEATAPSYINEYMENGTPFHAYYMTVSGHAGYTYDSNNMAKRHRAIIDEKYSDASENVRGYLASNMELEYAMAFLVGELEKNGIADDTLIVMTADHYPYGLVQDSADYYVELSGVQDKEGDMSRYRNTLIMWSAAFTEPVIIDAPASSIDIVPTICNLFGLEYDSRLYSGRDIFATNYDPAQASTCMPLVVFYGTTGNRSWITAAGSYDANTGVFTPKEGITVAD